MKIEPPLEIWGNPPPSHYTVLEPPKRKRPLSERIISAAVTAGFWLVGAGIVYLMVVDVQLMGPGGY